MSEMDVEAATSAIETAGGLDHLVSNQDPGVNSNPQPPDQQVQQQEVTPEAGTPEHMRAYIRDEHGRFAQEQQAPADSFVDKSDLASLLNGVHDPIARERIEQAYKSFQGGYTQKTQALAEQRKQYEALGDPAELQEAVDVYKQLQDPNTWPALHKELTTQLESQGYSFEQAQQIATQEITKEQQTPIDPLAQLGNDPDFVPVKNAFEAYKKEIDGMRAELDQSREEEKARQIQTAMLNELNRQEQIIRSKRNQDGTPVYDDTDINDMYELSSYYDGNLVKAQQKFDSMFNKRLGGYMERKQSASGAPPLPNANTVTAPPSAAPRSFEEAAEMADEYIRLQDLGGL